MRRLSRKRAGCFLWCNLYVSVQNRALGHSHTKPWRVTEYPSVHFHATVYTSVQLVMLVYSMVNLTQVSSGYFVIQGRKNALSQEVPAASLLRLCFSVPACLSMPALPWLLTSTSRWQSISHEMRLNCCFLCTLFVLFYPFVNVWRFGKELTFCQRSRRRYDVASTWSLVYGFNQWYIRYLSDTTLSQ